MFFFISRNVAFKTLFWCYFRIPENAFWTPIKLTRSFCISGTTHRLYDLYFRLYLITKVTEVDQYIFLMEPDGFYKMMHRLTLKIKPPRASALGGWHFFNPWFPSSVAEVVEGCGNAFEIKANTAELKTSEKKKNS